MDGRAWLRGSIAQPHFAIRWITFGPQPRRHTPYPLCCLVSGRFEIRRPPLLHTKATLKAKKVFLSPLAKLKNTQKVNQYNKEPASAFYFWQSKIEILKIKNICLYSKASKTLWSILMKLCMRKFVMRTSWDEDERAKQVTAAYCLKITQIVIFEFYFLAFSTFIWHIKNWPVW